jgi:proline iminopeptidase
VAGTHHRSNIWCRTAKNNLIKNIFIMKKTAFFALICTVFFAACRQNMDNCAMRTTPATGSVKLITVDGKYKVWTKKVGNGAIKVLLLHGGPGVNHEYFTVFEDYLPQAGIEFYYYDQLGSMNSEHPHDTTLWNVPRFLEEVEQVRKGLGLDSFYLLGHSWGGMLAQEYGIKYQQHLKGLIISNMSASIPSYLLYINALRQKLPVEKQAILAKYEAKNQYDAPEYQRVMREDLYNHYICRSKPWPDALEHSMNNVNAEVYNTMQGNNEFVVTGNFKNWNVWDKLPQIKVPTLIIGAEYDEMKPDDMRKMGKLIPHSQTVICPEGSHFCFWDDQAHYFPPLIAFLKTVEAGRFVGDKK